MKNGTIYPIPKDPTLPCTSTNARPLTMLETGLKILTHCLANRIQTIIKRNPIYSSMQYAFLPGRTIQDPIHLVEIAQANARKNNKEIHLTFLDLTQAFDRLEFWASDLALQRLNYPKQFTDLIDNLNTDSNRKIVTKDGSTTSWRLQCGVAQGEVLSPIRFITLMDILATWITKYCNGENPKKKKIGYKISNEDHSKQRRKLQTQQLEETTHIKHLSDPSEEILINGLMYCDDIALITDSR